MCCLFRSFDHFLIRLFRFLFLSCRNSSHILNINSLSYISFSGDFSHSIGGLFTLSIVSLIRVRVGVRVRVKVSWVRVRVRVYG